MMSDVSTIRAGKGNRKAMSGPDEVISETMDSVRGAPAIRAGQGNRKAMCDHDSS